MPANSVAENVLGTIGTICWTVQLIPQIWKSWRTKSTEGLSPWLVFLWGVSGPFLGVYTVVQNLNIPLIIQPHLFAFLCLTSWAQCLYYGKKYSKKKSLMIFLSVLAIIGGFEAGMIFAVKPSFNAGNDGPVKVFGIMSAVIISLALLPQYYEIYRHKEVIGISTTFMLIDCLGGVFSDLSLAFKDKFDVVAATTYSVVVVLDGVVLLLALILNPRAERRRQKQIQKDVEEAKLSLQNQDQENTSPALSNREEPTRRVPSLDAVTLGRGPNAGTRISIAKDRDDANV